MRAGRVIAASAAAVTIISLAAACSKNTGNNGANSPKAKVGSGAIATDPALSKGPAKPIPGAKRGGTLTTIQESDFGHLDPQRVYVSNASALNYELVRTLTMFKDDPKTGKQLLVGDLATNTGTDVNGDAKTWRFTLKKGLKYEDGSPITAADVGYGVARSFSPNLADGPHYIQQWLAGSVNYNKTYKGPYDGGKPLPPGVTVKGNSITFHFKNPEPDMPFAASWGTTAPIPKSQDTKPQKIDTRPFSSGPYKIDHYTRGSKLVAVRNKYWDPKTDPIRHDYFDKLVVEIGPDTTAQTNRLIADQGADQTAVSLDGAPPEMTSKVLNDPSLKDRTISGYLPYAARIDINCLRVTDVNVRKALNYAYDKAAHLKAIGGHAQGDISSTIMSPTVLGYNKYNAYPSPNDAGDVAKAKKLLGGKHPKLVYAYANTSDNQKIAVTTKQSLERAGFKIVLKPIDKDNYFTLIGRKNNPYDLYSANWGADWPSGSTVIPPLFDSNNYQDEGNAGTSYLTEPALDKEIEKVQAEPADKALKDWGKLDQEIMTKYAPCIPTYYIKTLTLIGSKVHGAFLGSGVGNIMYYNTWVG